MTIKLYSTNTCGFCNQAKKYFNSLNVRFIEYNVAEDEEKREEMVEKSGSLGVPVIDIDGEIIVGFNKKRFDKLLNSDNKESVEEDEATD